MTALRDQRGIGLLEALIASVIVAIGAIGVALMFANGQAFISAEGDNRVAVVLAQQKIEHIRAFGYTGLAAGCPPASPLPWCPGGKTENVPGSGSPPAGTPLPWCVPGEPCYKRDVEIACVDRDNYNGGSEACVFTGDDATAFLINITVTPIGDPKTRPVTLSSVLSPR